LNKRRKLSNGDSNKIQSELKLRRLLRSKEWKEKKDLKSIELSRLDLRKKDKIGLNLRESPMNKEWKKKRSKEKNVLKNIELSKIA